MDVGGFKFDPPLPSPSCVFSILGASPKAHRSDDVGTALFLLGHEPGINDPPIGCSELVLRESI